MRRWAYGKRRFPARRRFASQYITEIYLKLVVEKYSQTQCSWPIDWRPTSRMGWRSSSFRLRVRNLLVWFSQEIMRRTRGVRIFPNRQSCGRLVTAILMGKYKDVEHPAHKLQFALQGETRIGDMPGS
ncbi:MAG: hypothetical protein EPO32_01655 [Anaerolineae bacterium]|nr:MAG: hypothetical protein EPO32_01655 [Anaerolineae bacterium]